MTFEEIQQIIEGMLAVQRDIQNQQLATNDTLNKVAERLDRIAERQEVNEREIARIGENIGYLNVISQRQENQFQQFYGYHTSAETDRLNIMQNLLDIRRRLNAIEDKLA